MRGSYHQRNNLRGDGLNFQKKVLFVQPYCIRISKFQLDLSYKTAKKFEALFE